MGKRQSFARKELFIIRETNKRARDSVRKQARAKKFSVIERANTIYNRRFS